MRTKHAPKQTTALFPTEEKARARRRDPRTSYWAAQDIDVNARQAMCLDAFVSGPCTQHELIQRVRNLHGEDIAESTIRTGCSELESKGLVEVVGMGQAPSGKAARIYGRKVR